MEAISFNFSVVRTCHESKSNQRPVGSPSLVLSTNGPEFLTGVRVCRMHVIICVAQVNYDLLPTKL